MFSPELLLMTDLPFYILSLCEYAEPIFYPLPIKIDNNRTPELCKKKF